ncbi:MAG: hypothetical protein HOV68_30580 [Streptomycetaceae bacterium]|nr:hypothetical protein [Streptomycetaceae bacterium]
MASRPGADRCAGGCGGLPDDAVALLNEAVAAAHAAAPKKRLAGSWSAFVLHPVP